MLFIAVFLTKWSTRSVPVFYNILQVEAVEFFWYPAKSCICFSCTCSCSNDSFADVAVSIVEPNAVNFLRNMLKTKFVFYFCSANWRFMSSYQVDRRSEESWLTYESWVNFALRYISVLKWLNDVCHVILHYCVSPSQNFVLEVERDLCKHSVTGGKQLMLLKMCCDYNGLNFQMELLFVYKMLDSYISSIQLIHILFS